MTDLQINIALAKAMGWVELSPHEYWNTRKMGVYAGVVGAVCCDYDQGLRSKQFDYRDPVIFVAICERWKLNVNYHKNRVDGFIGASPFSQLAVRCEPQKNESMQRATALVVIELEGVKP